MTHRMLVKGGPSMGKYVPTKIFFFLFFFFFLRPARVITVAARGRKKGNLKTFIIFPSIFWGAQYFKICNKIFFFHLKHSFSCQFCTTGLLPRSYALLRTAMKETYRIKQVQGALTPGAKGPWREDDQSRRLRMHGTMSPLPHTSSWHDFY